MLHPLLHKVGVDANRLILNASPNIWMDATASSTLTLSGTNVVNWVSKVNSLQATQATSANQPKVLTSGINGRQALEFFHSGTASSLVMNDNAVMNWSEFFHIVVFERVTDTGVDEHMISKFNSAGNQREWVMAVNSVDRFQGSASTDGLTTVNVSASPAIAVGTPTIGVFWYQASDQKIYARMITATQDITATGTSMSAIFNGTSVISYGTRAGGVTVPYKGKIGEHISFAYLPPVSVRNMLISLTRTKWGIVP